jgi:hypothetical protein
LFVRSECSGAGEGRHRQNGDGRATVVVSHGNLLWDSRFAGPLPNPKPILCLMLVLYSSPVTAAYTSGEEMRDKTGNGVEMAHWSGNHPYA